ncbi:hypothetical protein ES703_118824 [subsurface metagenome]
MDVVTIKAYKEYQEPIAKYLKQNIKKKHKPILDETFGKHKWPHWIRTDLYGAALPGVKDWFKLKEIVGFDDTFDDKIYEVQKLNIPVFQSGRNPGDVIRNRDREVDWIEGKGGNESGIRSLSGSTYPYTRGKNPGDFWKSTPGYIVGKLAEKIRDFEDAHPDADLGWLDEIIKDIVCADPSSDFLYPGDFWEICTQPFTGYNPELEHFAVFPEELIVTPLKASCPRWVCKKCGKPRNRISKRNVSVEDAGLPQSERKEPYQQSKGISVKGGDNYTKWLIENPIETVGWSDCGCGEGFDAGVVLDPFCGRGTVGKVAKSLGMHYILFDIKPEYCELSRLYIGGQKYKLHKTQVKLDSFAQ